MPKPRKKPLADRSRGQERPAPVAAVRRLDREGLSGAARLRRPARQMPLSMIAKLADLDRSATQRLVHTLETLGYLPPRPQHAQLCADVQAAAVRLQLSQRQRAGRRRRAVSARRQQDRRRNHQSARARRQDIVYLARFPGQHIINVDIMVGSRLPAVLTASGTAILSRCPQDVVDAFFAPAPRPLTGNRWSTRRGCASASRPRASAAMRSSPTRRCWATSRSHPASRMSTAAPSRASASRSRPPGGPSSAPKSELVKHVQLLAASLSSTAFPAYR